MIVQKHLVDKTNKSVYSKTNNQVLFKSLKTLFQVTFSLVLIYASLVLIGGYALTAEPRQLSATDEKIKIYVSSNGWHTDIILPLSASKDLFQKVNTNRFFDKYSQHKWLAIGWGDKGFYNGSYTDSSLTARTCFEAALLPSETLMHLSFLKNAPTTSDDCISKYVSKSDYQSMLQHIEKSFRIVDDSFVRLPQKGYSHNDYFFEANGSYHLFYTCNSWTNEALQKTKVRTGLFVPFANTLMHNLKE